MGRFDENFGGLLPWDSPDYLNWLRRLPLNLQARACRKLFAYGCEESKAFNVILECLLVNSKTQAFLLRLAKKHVVPGQHRYTEEDLTQGTFVEIIKVLLTSRGEFAETSWFSFCRQRFLDAWRKLYGRHGEKIEDDRQEPYQVQETGETVDPVENAEGSGCANEFKSYLDKWAEEERLEKIDKIVKTLDYVVVNVNDPIERSIGRELFSKDRSPSSGHSKNGKPPLTKQFNMNRDKINRYIRLVKNRVKAALLADETLDLDNQRAELLLNDFPTIRAMHNQWENGNNDGK